MIRQICIIFVFLQKYLLRGNHLLRNMELIIEEGYCYQVLNKMLDIVTPTSAIILRDLASTKGVIEISKEEALKRGFTELANWSMPEQDCLFVINNDILICIPKRETDAKC